MTTTSRLILAEVAVEVVEAEVAAVVAPLEAMSREEPDKDLLRAERLSCPKKPSPPCDDRHRLNA